MSCASPSLPPTTSSQPRAGSALEGGVSCSKPPGTTAASESAMDQAARTCSAMALRIPSARTSEQASRGESTWKTTDASSRTAVAAQTASYSGAPTTVSSHLARKHPRTGAERVAPPRRPSARATAHSTGAEADLINPSSSSSDHAVNRFVRPARAPCSSARLNSNASERALRMLPSARCATQRTSRLGSRAHSTKKSSVCSAPRSASASIAATRIPSAPVRAPSSSSARASTPTCRTRTRKPWAVSSSPSSGKP